MDRKSDWYILIFVMFDIVKNKKNLILKIVKT